MDTFRLPTTRVFDDSTLKTFGLSAKTLKLASDKIAGPFYHVNAVMDAREKVRQVEHFLVYGWQ